MWWADRLSVFPCVLSVSEKRANLFLHHSFDVWWCSTLTQGTRPLTFLPTCSDRKPWHFWPIKDDQSLGHKHKITTDKKNCKKHPDNTLLNKILVVKQDCKYLKTIYVQFTGWQNICPHWKTLLKYLILIRWAIIWCVVTLITQPHHCCSSLTCWRYSLHSHIENENGENGVLKLSHCA